MAQVTATRVTTDAGGGGFALPDVTIGVFLVDQPGHRLALGQDPAVIQPLAAQEGWILPAGADGLCEYDTAHAFLTVAISGDLLEEVGLDDPGGVAPVVGAFDPLLLQLALQSETAGAGGTLYRETMHRALAAHLASLSAPRPKAVAKLDDPRLRRAVGYIQDNLADEITLTRLAAEAGMSAYHFARAFKAATGRSPLQYVIAARLETAQVLLKTTALPVAEIAYRVGYADTSRFGRHFKRAIGATPAAYRQG